ncbi:MAG: hypothetical protein Q7Q71_10630 [Verrucomicrobiota bacterium JB023]|nr:hypothetical protein [Verrucomicrobiota bacterium JB023]
MKGIHLAITLLSFSIFGTAAEQNFWEQINHNVRVMRHEDGTRTEYWRSNDETKLRKTRYSDVRGGKAALLTTTDYAMDKKGNPLSCRIYDGKGNCLFKVAYGYHKRTGRLVAEDMFDARTPKVDPSTGKEVPVRRIYWFYDANGNKSKPISFVFRAGKRAEDEFGPKTAPEFDRKGLENYEREDREVEPTFPFDNPYNPSLQNAAEPRQDDFLNSEPPPLPPLRGDR